MVNLDIATREVELERNARRRDFLVQKAVRATKRVEFRRLRVAELLRLFQFRYRSESLPDDDAGIGDLAIVLHHLAHGRGAMPQMLAMCSHLAPWLPESRAKALRENIAADPIKWRAGALAKKLNVTINERIWLGLTTIGAVGVDRVELYEMARQVKNKRRRLKRRAAGAKSQSESKSRLKPWIAEGISRATWYRRRRETVLVRAY